MVMTINPALTVAQVVETLKSGADDKGNPGWDESFGWGRVNYRKAVSETLKTLPRVLKLTQYSQRLEIAVQTMYPAFLTLERNGQLLPTNWEPVAQSNSTSNLTLFNDQTDAAAAFYRVRAEAAH